MISHLNYPAINTGVFPHDYSEARQNLLNRVKGLKHRHQPFLCQGASPEGEALVTDAFWLGPEDAANVLVLLAGTHGIEGYVGSAVESDHLALIENKSIELPAGTAVLMVHALTPWGYAWRRRCGEDGVDLNRNYVDFGKPLPVNAGYKLLRKALFQDDSKKRELLFQEYIETQGRTAFEIALSGGQYSDPTGPFYGGGEPAHGRLVTEQLIKDYALNERRLAVIDLHSGLGSYGYGEIICDHAANSPGSAVAKLWYGDSVASPELGTSSSVPKLGLMDYCWHEIMNTQSCHITLEFGTYATDQLFEVLMRDHQLWAGKDNSPARAEHSPKMLRHFCPPDRAWRELVLFRARQVIHQALQGLSASEE